MTDSYQPFGAPALQRKQSVAMPLVGGELGLGYGSDGMVLQFFYPRGVIGGIGLKYCRSEASKSSCPP